MIRHLSLACSALVGGILLAPQAGQAQQSIDSLGLTVTTTPAVMTDYSFRGLSQTQNRGAAQLTLDVEHSSGLYIGAFVSNVGFAGIDARQEIDLNIGYRFQLAGVKLDLGATYYWYPGYDAQPGAYEMDFAEVVLRSSYEIAPVKFVGMAAYSPNFNLESGTGIYVEGGFDMTLDFGFTISPRVGYQWIERNSRWGAEDYGNFSLTVSREIFAGFVGALTGVYTTLDDRADCFGGQKVCGTRVILSVSRPF